MKLRTWMMGGVALLQLAAVSWGAGFSTNPTGVAGNVGGGIVEGVCGPILLTQSESQTITALNSVACNAGGIHTDNSYFRAYDMSGYPDGFDVCEVQVGIESAAAGAPGFGTGVTQPVTVNVYSNTGAAFPPGTLALVGTAAVDVADQVLTILTVPLAASVPAGATQMVVEVFTPDGSADGNSFFIGSNSLDEDGPSYILAADCGILVPTPTGGIGFPDMQIVLNAVGDSATGAPSVIEIPSLGGWGLGLLGLLLAGAAFVALRKRTVA